MYIFYCFYVYLPEFLFSFFNELELEFFFNDYGTSIRAIYVTIANNILISTGITNIEFRLRK